MIPTPAIFKSQSFQAWALVLVLVFVVVLTYDSYTGKKLLKKVLPKSDPATPAV